MHKHLPKHFLACSQYALTCSKHSLTCTCLCRDVSQQSVQGPLTWRQFHRMAGSTTKGNTDDQCEPLPVPAITVGHEQDFLSLAPQALHYWEAMSLEPYAQPRDVAYIVVAPESEFVVGRVKSFFKNLSCVYEVRSKHLQACSVHVSHVSNICIICLTMYFYVAVMSVWSPCANIQGASRWHFASRQKVC